MDLGIRVDPRLKEPIYRQLSNAIAEQIREGRLPASSHLPSVRELALELRINPNTVARAYRELEIEGYVFSQRGKGVYVSSFADDQAGNLPPKVATALDHLIEVARTSGTPVDVLQMELSRRAHLSSSKEEAE